MSNAFDLYSKNYNNHVNDVLRITGYDTHSLIKAKLVKLQELFPDLVQLHFNLLDFGCGIGNLYESVKQFFHTHHTRVLTSLRNPLIKLDPVSQKVQSFIISPLKTGNIHGMI